MHNSTTTSAPVSPNPFATVLGRSLAWFYRGVVALFFLFLIGPIAIIIAASFTTKPSNSLPTEGMSLQWYRAFFQSENFTEAFVFSVELGVLAATIATVLGFLTAYGILRLKGRRRTLTQSFSLLPAMVPTVLTSMSLLLALNFVPLPQFLMLLVGHVLICMPFTIAGIIVSLDSIDHQIEAAAITLGASKTRAVIEVVVPLAAPGILSAFIFAFIVSFGDVYVGLFLAGPGMTTLPIEIFSFVQWDSTPVVAAVTTLQILLIVVLGLVVERLIGLRRIMRF